MLLGWNPIRVAAIIPMTPPSGRFSKASGIESLAGSSKMPSWLAAP